MKEYNRLLYILAFLVILFNFSSVFLHISVLFRGYIFSLLWLLLYAVAIPRKLVQIRFLWLGGFIVVASLYALMGGVWANLSSISQVILNALYFILPVIMYDFFIRTIPYKPQKFFIAFCFVVMAFLALRTIVIATARPDIVRLAVEDEELGEELKRFGCGSYALCHAVIFLFPAIIFGLKYKYKKLWERVLGISIILFLCYYIIMCGATGPLLLGILLIVASLLIKSDLSVSANVFRLILGVIIVGILFIAFNGLAYINLFGEWVSSENAIYGKIYELNDWMVYGSSEGDAAERSKLFQNSLKTFLANPIFGDYSAKLGGHNFFIDCLGAVGLIGTIPLLAFLLISIKKTAQSLKRECRPFFILNALIFVTHGFFKNYFGIELFLVPFCIVPLIFQIESSAVSDVSNNKKISVA